MKKLPFLCLLALACGCDTITQRLTTQRTLADGTVEIQSTYSRVSAKWDAKQTVEKMRVSNGKTQSVGVSGLDQESTTTNLAGNLRALTDLLKEVR